MSQSQEERYVQNIKGDGSCYYRAALWGALNEHFHRKQLKEAVTAMAAVIQALLETSSSHHIKSLSSEEIKTLNQAFNAMKSVPSKEVLHELLKRYDDLFIKTLRLTMALYIKGHKNDVIYDGITLQTLLVGDNDLDAWIAQNILHQSSYVEGAWIELGLIGHILQVRPRVVTSDASVWNLQSSYVGYVEQSFKGLSDEWPMIFLQKCRFQHYNLYLPLSCLFSQAPQPKVVRPLQVGSEGGSSSFFKPSEDQAVSDSWWMTYLAHDAVPYIACAMLASGLVIFWLGVFSVCPVLLGLMLGVGLMAASAVLYGQHYEAQDVIQNGY